MKILVAVPVYARTLPIQTVKCLMREQLHALLVDGDEFHFHFLPACSHAAMGRNQIAADFLAGTCDVLVFVDADVTTETTGAVAKIARLALKHQQVVGGAYRYKYDPEEYPVAWLPGPLRGVNLSDSTALLEVQTLPGGFLAIPREVFEKLKAAHPERKYEHAGHKFHCFFQFAYVHGAMYGEDSLFCREWLEAGGKIYLDPEIALTHWDESRPFAGHIGNWLKARAPVPIKGTVGAAEVQHERAPAPATPAGHETAEPLKRGHA